jgi:hypothetical protein
MLAELNEPIYRSSTGVAAIPVLFILSMASATQSPCAAPQNRRLKPDHDRYRAYSLVGAQIRPPDSGVTSHAAVVPSADAVRYRLSETRREQ